MTTTPVSVAGLVVVVALATGACVTVPSGPTVMVLPGTGKNFEQFQADNAECRNWAGQQTGTTPTQAATHGTATSAVIGTVVGAAAGAAIGAAAGNPALGAAVGAGSGLFGGTIFGASASSYSTYMIQRQYDYAYMQCMYAKGNQIPTAGGTRPAYATSPARWTPPPPPPPASSPPAPPAGNPPPPPAGMPPPPPPGAPPPPPTG